MFGQPIGRVAARSPGAPEVEGAHAAHAPELGAAANPPAPRTSLHPPVEPRDVFSHAHEKASFAMEQILARDLQNDALADAARRFDAIAHDNLPALMRARGAGAHAENARIARAARFAQVLPAPRPAEEVYDEEHGRGAEEEGGDQKRRGRDRRRHSDEEQPERQARQDNDAFDSEDTRLMERPVLPPPKRVLRSERRSFARSRKRIVVHAPSKAPPDPAEGATERALPAGVAPDPIRFAAAPDAWSVTEGVQPADSAGARVAENETLEGEIERAWAAALATQPATSPHAETLAPSLASWSSSGRRDRERH